MARKTAISQALPPPLPDWKLPPGVDRSLWDYLHDDALAAGYDAGLADCSLIDADVSFCSQWFSVPGRLIDLGCGTGRLLVPFAARGFSVLGVDLSEPMLRVAAERARLAGVRVELLQANLVELSGLRDASFDFAACLFSTLGMIRGSAHRATVLDHVARLLRPGGRFVLHVHNHGFAIWDRAGRGWWLMDQVRRITGADDAGDRPMPTASGQGGLRLHHFTRREAVRAVRAAGLRVLEVRPVGLGPEGRLPAAWWWPSLRAYGYLIAAER